MISWLLKRVDMLLRGDVRGHAHEPILELGFKCERAAHAGHRALFAQQTSHTVVTNNLQGVNWFGFLQLL